MSVSISLFYHVRTLFPSSAATHCTYFNWSAIINKSQTALAEGHLAHFAYQWNKWVTAVGWSIIDGVMVEPWTRPEARSGKCLCSRSSLGCLLNRIYFQVCLAFFRPCGLIHTAVLSIYYRFSWNIFLGPLMLGNHFLPPQSLFLPFYYWKIEQWPKKRKCGEPFTVLSYKRRPMQTLSEENLTRASHSAQLWFHL